MERKRIITIISLLIIILSAVASILAIMPAGGHSYTITSQWGEDIEMYGRGLYQKDSHSYAVQAIAQDWVTILLGIPMLTASLLLARRGSFRGKLLLTGVLGYFLYTYMSYSFLMTYNRVFLIYVSLFSLSLFGFILAFLELKVEKFGERIGAKFPRKSTAVFFIFIGTILSLMWLGRILPSLKGGGAPIGLETYTTLVIQAMDLGIIVPLAFITAISLLRRRNIGYALSAIVVLKGATLFSAISAMAILMIVNGIEVNAAELVIFPAATLINFVFCFLILRNVR